MDKKYSKEEIYNKLCEILEEEFEIDKTLLNSDANLFTDLDLDSIDAVDLAVRLQQFTDKRISPEEFKQIRTLDDVVKAIYNLV
ncbi:MAG: acyl carrier protein [Candidatus Gastranaerophilaceae bacterium]|nr:acyl carrier protein [Candidatus Gastranaerophilaceae bacterium]